MNTTDKLEKLGINNLHGMKIPVIVTRNHCESFFPCGSHQVHEMTAPLANFRISGSKNEFCCRVYCYCGADFFLHQFEQLTYLT